MPFSVYLQCYSFDGMEPIAGAEACSRFAIRAHSVQNAAVMDLLHRNGHPTSLTPNRRNADRFELIWSDIGRNLATTFEGFCFGARRCSLCSD